MMVAMVSIACGKARASVSLNDADDDDGCSCWWR
jgi:hypothetical protein